MYTYRRLILNVLVSSIVLSSAIHAQQFSQSIEVAPESPQGFTGSRKAPPAQQLGNQPSQQIQHAQVQQFNGKRNAPNAPKAIVTEEPTNQPAMPYQGKHSSKRHSSSAKNHRQLTLDAALRQKPVFVAPVQSIIRVPEVIQPTPHEHAYGINRQIIRREKISRQRPVIVHRSAPQTIVINQRSAVCPYVTLTPLAVAKKGNFIELSDGSIWKVRQRDRSKVKRWATTDDIIIETGKFFSWYAYNLVNYTRGESIDVELYLSDDWNGSSSHWIAEINPMQGYVKLENDSIWRLSTSEIASWNLGDDVIIGLSKDWFSSHYNYVLINPKAKARFTATFEF